MIPSVLPLFTTTSHSISSSTLKPDISTVGYTEATRFPTRKPTESTTKVTLTTESIIRPISIHTIGTQSTAAVTKQPQTTISALTEKSSVTTQVAAAAATTTSQIINTTDNDNDNEEILSTTEQQSVSMFDEFDETTTTTSMADYTELSETEHILNHTTSAPLLSNTQSTVADTTVKISEFNSTPSILFTESSVTVSQTASHFSIGVYILDFV